MKPIFPSALKTRREVARFTPRLNTLTPRKRIFSLCVDAFTLWFPSAKTQYLLRK